jgi:hypothetical protein
MMLGSLVLTLTLFTGQGAPVKDVYQLREAAEYAKERGGADAPHVATSEHFAINWGDENQLNYPITDEYIKNALAYFERLRDLYVNQLHFPMRQSDGKKKFKNNIYISRTGLKPFLEGYAFGFPDPEGYGVFVGEPSIMVPGHGASAHELAHAMQGESLGFRDSDYVGWFWECHAQFMAHQANPGNLPEVLDLYTETASFDWSSTRHHYGSWIFLQYLMEKKGYGIGFINSLWFEPKAFQDEDAVLKMKRLGKLSEGKWADLFGDFAKRNVTFGSYARGAQYRASLTKLMERTPRSRTPLERDPVKPGWWRVPYHLAPQQNAYNVVQLIPTAGKVSVTFEGFVDPERKSAWRNTLVVVNGKDGERFGRTWNQGKQTVELKPDDKQVYLVVAATPGVFRHIKFLEDQRNQDRFPYRVRIEGAEPAGKDILFRPTAGAPHSNGGGFVADTAKVEPTAYVGPNALVSGKAQVSGEARIEDWAVVTGEARVSDHAVVGGHARVAGRAKVGGYARVKGRAWLLDDAVVEGNARVVGFPRFTYRPHVRGNALVKDQANLYGADISGTAIIMGGADPSGGLKCTKGVFTNFVEQQACDRAKDDGGLVADYGFTKRHAFLLRDPFGANEGFLVGSPKWVSGGLEFGGGDGVELPAWMGDWRSVTFDLSVRRAAGPAGQRLLDFGGYSFTPEDAAGKAALVLAGKTYACAKALPLGKWVEVRIVFDGASAFVWFDGEEVLNTGAIGFAPENARPTMAHLGCSAERKDGFRGEVRKLTVTRGALN